MQGNPLFKQGQNKMAERIKMMGMMGGRIMGMPMGIPKPKEKKNEEPQPQINENKGMDLLQNNPVKKKANKKPQKKTFEE